MIKIENTQIVGLEPAIRGMRNPMNSWSKSDSDICTGIKNGGTEYTCPDCKFNESRDSLKPSQMDFNNYVIGPNDLELMNKLAKAGPVHAKYRRMIVVYCDIVAPMYWWSEYDTYKVGTVANSCSKMHKLLSKPFEMSDFSFDMLPGYKNEITQFRPYIDEETEIWKPINNAYDVSSYGRVRHGSRILSGSLHADGYIFATIFGKQYPVHRLAAEAFIENPLNKSEVNHIDGNKQNNAIDNLEWVTSSENQKHAVQLRLQPNQVKTYKGKFTEEQRQEIKRRWDSGESIRQLANHYNVSHTCICSIVHDKYKYVENTNVYEELAKPLVDMLNELRDSYLTCSNDDDKKKIWYTILSLLPVSYNQRRTVMVNYEVLSAMYAYRSEHKLYEWRTFCKWIESLPYSELITGKKKP